MVLMWFDLLDVTAEINIKENGMLHIGEWIIDFENGVYYLRNQFQHQSQRVIKTPAQILSETGINVDSAFNVEVEPWNPSNIFGANEE